MLNLFTQVYETELRVEKGGVLSQATCDTTEYLAFTKNPQINRKPNKPPNKQLLKEIISCIEKTNFFTIQSQPMSSDKCN